MALRDTASLLVGLLLLFHTWGAWADVEVSMEDKVEVYNGETAQITCMYTSEEGIGGTMIQWFYVTRSNEKQRIYFQDSTIKITDRDTDFTDRISVNGTGGTGEVVLTISPVQLQDEGEFICLIKGLTEGTGEGRTKLKVFETPQLPTIEGVQTGISVNEVEPSKIGTCEVKNGYPKPNITWYKDNTPLRPIPDEVHVVSTSTHSSGLFSVKSDLSMKVEKKDKDAEFYCEVTYYVPGETRMTETTRINVTVHYPPTAVNIWVESPKGKIKEGDSIELQCSGNGNSPFSVFTIKKTEDETSWDGNMVQLENVTRSDSGVYECMSMDMETLAEVSRNTSVFVNYLDDAVLMVKDSNEVPLGGGLEATCNALSSLHTETVWLKDGEEVARGHTLILKDATFDTAGTYMCVVTVPEIEGMTTSEAFRVYVQGPPEIVEQDTELESYDSTIDLTCHVRGYPVPTIVWTTSDQKVVKTVSQTDTESVARVPVTSDITVFCNASNEYGTDAVTFNIKAITLTTTTTTTVADTTVILNTTVDDTPVMPNTMVANTTVILNTTVDDTTVILNTTVDDTTVKPETAPPSEKIQKESNGVIIAVIILCILLLAILGSVLYFLYKKGKICGRSGKQDLTKEKSNKDNIVVEMKSDNTEEAILLGVNGEKLPPSDQ